jgi:hypothetical protein
MLMMDRLEIFDDYKKQFGGFTAYRVDYAFIQPFSVSEYGFETWVVDEALNRYLVRAEGGADPEDYLIEEVRCEPDFD